MRQFGTVLWVPGALLVIILFLDYEWDMGAFPDFGRLSALIAGKVTKSELDVK